MSVRGIEPIIDGVLSEIQTNINAALAVVEADGGLVNIGSLPRPASYFISARENFEQFPVVIVLGEHSTHSTQTSTAAYDTAESGGGHELTVTWIDRADDPEVLRRMMYRAARALRQIFLDHNDLGGTVMFVQVTGEDYFPTAKFGKDEIFYQAVQLQLTAQIDEVI